MFEYGPPRISLIAGIYYRGRREKFTSSTVVTIVARTRIKAKGPL